ncbi:MAG: diacylglycerol kinase family protein [Chloroflexi bacterium]|nr:diacylglycerol kinase family protein [Chloroflexota bacterium]
MSNFITSRLRSFVHAFHGWAYVLRTQHNAWIHAVITIIVVALGLWLRLSARDWVMLIMAILLVWMAEFLNTAIEAVVDLASPAKHPLAKVGKDVGAAAVLIAALGAVLIGLLILGPSLWSKIAPLITGR